MPGGSALDTPLRYLPNTPQGQIARAGILLRRPARRLDVRRKREVASFADGDVEPSAAVESCLSRSDAASAQVAHSPLWGAGQFAELLERDKSDIGPVIGDLDRIHVLALRRSSAAVISCLKAENGALCGHGRKNWSPDVISLDVLGDLRRADRARGRRS